MPVDVYSRHDLASRRSAGQQVGGLVRKHPVHPGSIPAVCCMLLPASYHESLPAGRYGSRCAPSSMSTVAALANTCALGRHS